MPDKHIHPRQFALSFGHLLYQMRTVILMWLIVAGLFVYLAHTFAASIS